MTLGHCFLTFPLIEEKKTNTHPHQGRVGVKKIGVRDVQLRGAQPNLYQKIFF